LLAVTSAAQQVSFMKYTVYDGLVANPVRCIYQDSKGFIWIGTFEGLSRYDGYKFTNYSTLNGLSHNFINSLYEANGKLLVAENNGAVDIIENSVIQKGFKLPSAVNYIMPGNNRLLLTTDTAGFYEYTNDTIIYPLQQNTGTPLGHFAGYNDSLIIGDGVDNNFFVFKNDLSLYASLSYANIFFYSIAIDSRKRIWACTTSGLKLVQLPPEKNQPVIFAPQLPAPFNIVPLSNSFVTSMIEEKDGSYWIGTMNGLIHLSTDGKFQLYNEKDGLPSAEIRTLYHDKENNLWIGTGLGLAKWVSKNNITFYNTENNNFKNDIGGIHLVTGNKTILATRHGLQQFNFETKEFKNINGEPLTPYIPIVNSIPLLVHYRDNIGVWDESKNNIAPLIKLDTTVTEVYRTLQHSSGTIFLGTGYGLYAVNKTSVKKILPYRITCLMEDSNSYIWAGTWINGLYRINVNPLTGSNNYEIQEYTSLFNHKEIRSLFNDSKKNIWVGTRYGGAYCLTPNDNNGFQIKQYNRFSGIMSDWIKSIAETKDGDIWVGNYLGLDRLVKEPNGFRVFNFSKATNFFAQIENIVSMGDDNWLCVANTGIAFFKDEAVHKTLPLQALVLSAGMGVRDNKINIIFPQEKIPLTPSQNAARFEFSALGFTNEKQVMYSYRLKGSNDTGWSKPENIHEASYASLPPGNYTFEVKTIGWNGNDGIPASFPFFISTPFWKQGWFIGLCIFLTALFFYALYRYRINQLLRLQKVRNSIATDLHDDIGSTLTNISILSELSNKNITQPEKAQPFLQRISEEVQASSQAMDDIIWSVNSNNDSLDEILARMRRYAAELFDNSDTICHLQLDDTAGNKKLGMEQRRDVYLIYKEALNNIHKHAAAANVQINVSQIKNYLWMKIEDDGKGFDTGTLTHRNGLKNLATRVEKWKGNISIQSIKDKGTVIEIKLPLKE
jgi:ligand-binding sensor domain-containing protein/two-component sensor histidine kinase